QKVLPKNIKAKLAIEAGVGLGWAKYVGEEGETLTVDEFGLSAPAEDVFRFFGFTVENIIERSKKMLERLNVS
ncbi:MAG: transketolase-like TK C-terminal-containing protein, partial [Pyrinomonadaceae bacterium]